MYQFQYHQKPESLLGCNLPELGWSGGNILAARYGARRRENV